MILKTKKVKQFDKPIGNVVHNIESQHVGIFDKAIKKAVIDITMAIVPHDPQSTTNT